jgi:hypothetical protein
MKVDIKNIACAAWMLFNKEKFIGLSKDSNFTFETNKTEAEWLSDFFQTDYYGIDNNLLQLKRLVQREGNKYGYYTNKK